MKVKVKIKKREMGKIFLDFFQNLFKILNMNLEDYRGLTDGFFFL
jgi:ribosomal protein L5